MASAHHAESALGHVRGGVLRDALYDGTGARVLADRSGTVQPAKAIKSSTRHSDSAGHLRGDSLHAASVVAGHALSDRSREAVSALVHAVAAGVLLPVGDRRGISDDDLRIILEFQAFRIAAGVARPAGTRAGSGRGARSLCDFALRRSGESRRTETGAASGIRDVPFVAGDLNVPHLPPSAAVATQSAHQRQRALLCCGAGGSRFHHQPYERKYYGLRRIYGSPVLSQVDRVGGHRLDHCCRLRTLRTGSEVPAHLSQGGTDTGAP